MTLLMFLPRYRIDSQFPLWFVLTRPFHPFSKLGLCNIGGGWGWKLKKNVLLRSNSCQPFCFILAVAGKNSVQKKEKRNACLCFRIPSELNVLGEAKILFSLC